MKKKNNNKSTKPKALSLFSGCGGMDLGAVSAGVDAIWCNEIHPVFCKTIRSNFPGLNIIEGDIADVTSFPKADLVFGGYPCQSFSIGGNRNPEKDKRTYLYKHFARVLSLVQPKYFIAENVSGLQKVKAGVFLKEQLDEFENAGDLGYIISAQVIDAKDYGIPQTRKRVFIVGVRKDINLIFVFPKRTHGSPKDIKKNPLLNPYGSHGEVIKDLPLHPERDYYHRPHDPDKGFSWYYMSRNRKADWDSPSYTIVANWRHTPLHPASPVMKLTWSDLANGWKQRWDFSKEYEHTKVDPKRPILKDPRRLSYRECARIQTFPNSFIFEGNIEEKFEQIGNAVPPKLFEIIVRHLVTGKGLVEPRYTPAQDDRVSQQLPFFYTSGTNVT